MGAEDFSDVARGKDAQEAFRSAVEEAQYEYGHGGYTGSIAEKHGFIMVAREPLASEEARKLKSRMEEEDDRYNDKWGPACCVELLEESPVKGSRLFWFFGIASS